MGGSKIVLWGGLSVATLLIVGTSLYFFDMRRAHVRIEQRGEVVPTSYGDIEYTERGEGPDVLVIHGSGGGHDQGELVVDAVLDDSFHNITPSRFGYLRSTFHDGATFDEQAHAYAALLDHLGLERVAVVALSHGGPSALLFATLHPERVSSLTLISAGVASTEAANQAEASEKGDTLTTIFSHDWLYWGATKLFRGQFLQLLGANESVVAGLSEEQQQLAERFIDWMNPVSRRSAGVKFDNQATMPGERISAIVSPTLILHAKDDGLQVFQNAQFAASHIPGARLVAFETGGHLLMVTEQGRIRELTQEHIRRHRVDVIAK